jgi:uncharacterized protein
LARNVGTRLATRLSGAEQLGIFATIMLVAAGFMLRRRQAGAGSHATTTAASVLFTAIQGLVVGSLTGLVGVGGGFLIVPASIAPRVCRAPVRRSGLHAVPESAGMIALQMSRGQACGNEPSGNQPQHWFEGHDEAP